MFSDESERVALTKSEKDFKREQCQEGAPSDRQACLDKGSTWRKGGGERVDTHLFWGALPFSQRPGIQRRDRKGEIREPESAPRVRDQCDDEERSSEKQLKRKHRPTMTGDTTTSQKKKKKQKN